MRPATLLTLGRQPEIGLAELESLYGSEAVIPFGKTALLNKLPKEVDFNRLGGSTRLCKVLTELPSTRWGDIKSFLLQNVVPHANQLPEGKLTIGLSVIDLKISVKDMERTLLEIKKQLKTSGRPIRIVPNKLPELNAAQVIHNKLTSELGWELVIAAHGSRAWLAQTIQIQDISAYTERDHGRPYRDARVGMLPPKLAQVLVNLATGQNMPEAPLLDPFCGTGVVLQEATLMGLQVYGSDLEPRMVEYSIGNLHWLREKYPEQTGDYVRVEQGDATNHRWQPPIGTVVAETYLGQPLTTLPPRDQLQKIIRFVDTLHAKFLKNLGSQITPGTRLCLAVPAWSNGQSFLHLPLLDHLKELGYNEVKFQHAGAARLVYHRPGQVVAREIVVITKD